MNQTRTGMLPSQCLCDMFKSEYFAQKRQATVIIFFVTQISEEKSLFLVGGGSPSCRNMFYQSSVLDGVLPVYPFWMVFPAKSVLVAPSFGRKIF